MATAHERGGGDGTDGSPLNPVRHDPSHARARLVKLADSSRSLSVPPPDKTHGYDPAADAINERDWYHGTNATGLTVAQLDGSGTNIANLFGQGIYLTDQRSVAAGYARNRSKRSGTPTIYRSRIAVHNPLNIEGPADATFLRILSDRSEKLAGIGWADLPGELQATAQQPGATNDDLYRTFREGVADFSAYEYVPTTELAEDFQELAGDLRAAGFDALTHVGGKRTGDRTNRHQVVVILDPSNTNALDGPLAASPIQSFAPDDAEPDAVPFSVGQYAFERPTMPAPEAPPPPAPLALPPAPVRALLGPGPAGPPAPTPSAPTAPLPAATPAPSPPPRVHRPATAAPPGRSDSSRLPRIALALAGLGVVGAAAFAMMVASLMGGLNAQDSSTSSPSALAVADIPPDILPIYLQAGQSRGLDWAYLAAIGKIETDHGRSTAPGVKSGVNSYGCCAGPMQFSITGPGGGTWGAYGVDGNHDGQTSVYDPADAIPAAADYLKASGAPGDWDRAIFAYNHAFWYVAQVKRQAQLYRDAAKSPTELQTGGATTQRLPNGAPWLVAIPGTTARCDSRIARDVMALMERYKLALGDCYAASGHELDGEHPLGLATDFTPGPGGSWALVEHLARNLGWTETCAASGCAGTLPPPFRFIGYNGFPGHGDPAHAGSNAHLHLSWQHSAATAGEPATVVQTLLKP